MHLRCRCFGRAAADARASSRKASIFPTSLLPIVYSTVLWGTSRGCKPSRHRSAKGIYATCKPPIHAPPSPWALSVRSQ